MITDAWAIAPSLYVGSGDLNLGYKPIRPAHFFTDGYLFKKRRYD